MTGREAGTRSLVRDLGFLLLAAAVLVGWVLFGDNAQQPSSASVRYAAMQPAQPSRLVVPSLDIRAPVVPIEVTQDGQLLPPGDADTVGWWQRSARPGARKGQTVVTGHTLSKGAGALDELGKVRRGAVIDLVTAKGRMRYRVQRVKVWSYQEVAARAAHLFAQDRQRGRLVLVTCTDFDGQVYRSNVIVFGKPLGRPVKGAA